MHDPLNGHPPGGMASQHSDLATALLMDLSHETRRQSHMLGWMVSRLESGSQFHREVRSHMTRTDSRLVALEKAPARASRVRAAVDLIRELEPVSKWLAGAALVAASLAGHTWPAEIKAMLLAPFGGP